MSSLTIFAFLSISVQFPLYILKAQVNQPPYQLEANCFMVKNGHQARGFRLTSVTTLQQGCSKHHRKQQNYFLPRWKSAYKRSRTLKNSVTGNAEHVRVRDLPNSVTKPSSTQPGLFPCIGLTFFVFTRTSVLLVPLNLQNCIFASKSQLFKELISKINNFFFKAQLFAMACQRPQVI